MSLEVEQSRFLDYRYGILVHGRF